MDEVKRLKKDTQSKIVIDMLNDWLDEIEETVVNTHCKVNKVQKKAWIVNDEEMNEALEYGMIGLADLRRKRSKILKYMSEIRVNYLISDEQTKRDNRVIGILSKENKDLKSEIQYLKNKITQLENEPREYIQLPPESNKVENVRIETIDGETYSRVTRLLNLFEDNVKSIAVSEKMKESQGRQVDNRITSLIVENYEKGMTPVLMQNKLATKGYKVSLPTIIERMKENGWYNGRKSK